MPKNMSASDYELPLIILCRPEHKIRYQVDEEFENSSEASLLEHAGSIFKENFEAELCSFEQLQDSVRHRLGVSSQVLR